jgi:hypothetical protein
VLIKKELFQEVSDVNVAKKLFRENVDTVEIGISSYCNRTCSYCPNSFVDRRSVDNQMSDELFDSIVRQLKEINYSKTITIHRYNEPFADFPYALKRIKALKHLLPNSRLEISTNGDYLNKERLVQLGENLTERDGVHITLHFMKQDKDYEKRKEELRKIVQGLGFMHTEYNETNLKTSTWLNFGQKCKIEYRVINFWASTPTQMITDRGEALSELKTIKARTLPCFTTVSQMQIEYDGSLQPCCNIHSSVKSHDKFSLGKLDANSNLFLTYCSSLYAKWRKSMISFEEKGSPCSSCTDATPHDGKDSVTNRIRIELFKLKAKF